MREQIRIARGEALDYDTAPPQRGHAIEVRLYAEDAATGYLPTTGTLLACEWPDAPGLRVDAGVERGSEISIHYDPMLAKVIAHGPTRRDAIQQLAWALDRAWLPGLVTNREHLARILRHPAFVAGELDTHFLESHGAALRVPDPSDDDLLAAVAVASLAATAARVSDPVVPPGWRNVPAGPLADQRVTYRLGDRALSLSYRELDGGRVLFQLGDRVAVLRRVSASPTAVTIEDERGLRRTHRVARDGAKIWVEVGALTLTLTEEPRFPDPDATAHAGGLVAPMPGKVVKVLASAGDTIEAGAILLVLEAMKMEHAVRATSAGTVTTLHVALGDQVVADQLLATVE